MPSHASQAAEIPIDRLFAYPIGKGSAAILPSIAPKRRRVRTLSASTSRFVCPAMNHRYCARRHETTRWQPGEHTGMPEIEVEPRAIPATAEKRRAKRIRLVMRLRVRNNWGLVEVAQTRDVSKLGLCFFSDKLFNVRDEVFMTLPFAANSVPVETKGRIVWSRPASNGRYYGVEYLR